MSASIPPERAAHNINDEDAELASIAHGYMQAALTGLLANPTVTVDDAHGVNASVGVIASVARDIALAALEQDAELIARVRARKWTPEEKVKAVDEIPNCSVCGLGDH